MWTAEDMRENVGTYADKTFFCWCCLNRAEYEIRGTHPHHYEIKVSHTCEKALSQTMSAFNLLGYTVVYDKVQRDLSLPVAGEKEKRPCLAKKPSL